ncbi:hypothetical protein OF83DRAFT_1051187 [Amylostereum chailletii]|nr:hypothetical protein OF83DRAFT_1051187 [Amylostereum chailletii]
MANTSVIIIGGGISGPILAIFLKIRGYQPVVYERLPAFIDLGVGLMLQPNGLKVLSSIPGFVEAVTCKEIARLRSYSTLDEDPGLLGESLVPSTLRSQYGSGMVGVRRTALHSTIVQFLEKHGVEIRWGHQLASVEQGEDSVTAVFEHGEKATASFLVGCDGLHSATRVALFGKESAIFTGLTQTGGICPTPSTNGDLPSAVNWFGQGAHMIAYPITDTLTSWAITLREEESKETWRAADKDILEKVQSSPRASWGYGASELIKTTERLVKFGLYDRPELNSWHIGRVVLLGDAAHPTSPHLGQGANQAFEDVYHLTRLLDEQNLDRTPLDTTALDKIFTAYESIRIPRASALVQGARKQGESRVVQDVNDCKTRDEDVRRTLKDNEGLQGTYARLYGDIVAKSIGPEA